MQLADLKFQNNTNLFNNYLLSVEAFNFDKVLAELSVKKDKSPDFINEAYRNHLLIGSLSETLRQHKISLAFIQPGKPI